MKFSLVHFKDRWIGWQRGSRSLRPVDTRAFRALMDRPDEAFLREKLSRAEFFRLKRLRIRVIWKYVRYISDNSEAVMESAIIARQSPDTDDAKVARECAELAWQINGQCLVALAKLTVEYMFPTICLTRNKIRFC